MMGRTEERWQVTMTPLPPGSRLWATAAVRANEDETVEIIARSPMK